MHTCLFAGIPCHVRCAWANPGPIRAARNALPPAQAWERVSDWLAAEVTWIPEPGARYADILGGLIRRYEIRGNLVTDAQLAALALEHGLTVCSADTDFARFSDLRWENPLAA